MFRGVYQRNPFWGPRKPLSLFLAMPKFYLFFSLILYVIWSMKTRLLQANEYRPMAIGKGVLTNPVLEFYKVLSPFLAMQDINSSLLHF